MRNNVDVGREWLHLISGVIAGAGFYLLLNLHCCCCFYFSRKQLLFSSDYLCSQQWGLSSVSVSGSMHSIFSVRIGIQGARS